MNRMGGQGIGKFGSR